MGFGKAGSDAQNGCLHFIRRVLGFAPCIVKSVRSRGSFISSPFWSFRSLGFNSAQYSPTARPSVERTADTAFLHSDRVQLSSTEVRVEEIKGGSVGLVELEVPILRSDVISSIEIFYFQVVAELLDTECLILDVIRCTREVPLQDTSPPPPSNFHPCFRYYNTHRHTVGGAAHLLGDHKYTVIHRYMVTNRYMGPHPRRYPLHPRGILQPHILNFFFILDTLEPTVE